MDKINELLTRGIDKIYPSVEELEKILKSGKKLRIYQGFDPTGTQLHIGHIIGLRKLKQWQDLGHQVIFLIGDGTGQAGDPSGKIEERKNFFNRDELRKNSQDYIMQASKIVRFQGENPVEIRYNGDWLNELKMPEILEIIGHFTLQQLIERDLFQERIKKGIPVNMREFIYPILQGYDSVVMEVNVELGGSDQMFNMLTGRTLLKEMKNKDKFVMTTPLLTDSLGRKIGKSEGNVIALTDKAEDLYGKIMNLGDEIIGKGFEYLTTLPMDEVSIIKTALEKGENPMTYKKKLAYEIVKELNNENEAKNAQEYFEKTIQDKEIPAEILTLEIKANDSTTVTDGLIINIVNSRSEAKRLIEQGAVEIDGRKITDPNEYLKPGQILKAGKRNFRKIVEV